MEVSEIEKLNQDLYEIDSTSTPERRVIFVATLVLAVRLNKDFSNSANLTKLVEFVKCDENGNEPKPVDQIVNIAKMGLINYGLQGKTQEAVFSCLDEICGSRTKFNENREELKKFILNFLDIYYPSIKPSDLFFETLYKEVIKKADTNKPGIILTPDFIAKLMIDILDLDYKKDILADLCTGTGLFSLLGYSTMLSQLNSDREKDLVTRDEYNNYEERLFNSIIANDFDPIMVTICLANFMLNKSINLKLLFKENCLDLNKSSFHLDDGAHIQPTKAILNPPYEDKAKPLEIVLKNIELVKQDGTEGHKVVVIIPPQKFGQKKDIFSKILNLSTLQCIIKTQDDLFVESSKAQPASIFVFDTTRAHKKDDVIRYFDFTDSGYHYYKDSGLRDKYHTYEKKESELLEMIRKKPSKEEIDTFFATQETGWSNFYETNMTSTTFAQIDPDRVKLNSDEADITIENITIKKSLREKRKLLDSVDNCFTDPDGNFEKYIIDILSRGIK